MTSGNFWTNIRPIPERPTEPDIDAATAAEMMLLSLPDEAWEKYTASHVAESTTGAMYTDESGRVRWTDPEFDRQVQEMLERANREE